MTLLYSENSNNYDQNCLYKPNGIQLSYLDFNFGSKKTLLRILEQVKKLWRVWVAYTIF